MSLFPSSFPKQQPPLQILHIHSPLSVGAAEARRSVIRAMGSCIFLALWHVLFSSPQHILQIARNRIGIVSPRRVHIQYSRCCVCDCSFKYARESHTFLSFHYTYLSPAGVDATCIIHTCVCVPGKGRVPTCFPSHSLTTPRPVKRNHSFTVYQHHPPVSY